MPVRMRFPTLLSCLRAIGPRSHAVNARTRSSSSGLRSESRCRTTVAPLRLGRSNASTSARGSGATHSRLALTALAVALVAVVGSMSPASGAVSSVVPATAVIR